MILFLQQIYSTEKMEASCYRIKDTSELEQAREIQEYFGPGF